MGKAWIWGNIARAILEQMGVRLGGLRLVPATGVREGLLQKEYANETKHRDAAVSLAVAEVAQVIFG